MSTPVVPKKAKTPQASGGKDQGMIILSYLIAGMALYGGLGWCADHFLNTKFGLPAGILIGMAISLYVIFKRFGSTE